MTPERLQYVREAHGRGMEPHWYHAVTSELLAEIDRQDEVIRLNHDGAEYAEELLEKQRAELRDAHNDLLDVRGILSPNGSDPVTPLSLVPTVAPAVQWLVDALAAVEQDRDRLSDELARVDLRQEWSILHPHSGISYGPNNRTQLEAIIAGWPGQPKPQLVWRWVSDWQPVEDAAEHSGSEPVVEHAIEMSGGGMHIRNDDPEVDRIFPLADWIKSHQRFGGHVWRRTVRVVEDWSEIPREAEAAEHSGEAGA